MELTINSLEDLHNLEGWVITDAHEQKGELHLTLQKNELRAKFLVQGVLNIKNSPLQASLVASLSLRAINFP